MSTFYLLGRCYQFGFGYAKLNRTALQLRSIADINLRYIIIKFGYDVRFHWLIQRAESEYKHGAELICQLLLCPTIFRTSLSLFSSIKSEISEQASRQVASDEPKKGL